MKHTEEFARLGKEVLFKSVKIPALEKQHGMIVSVFVGEMGVQYNVRYFLNGEVKTVYMFDHEIQEMEQ